MIQLKNVEFGYDKNRKLFNGVDLQLEPGHFYGLLGRNGAGKTTLLKIKQYEEAFAPFYPNFSHEQFMYYLTEFEMDNMLGFIDKFSHGQKKKVMIAFALAANVPLLIMDEPTNGLDIPSKSIFRKFMAAYADEQKTVLISTHQVRDLHSLIDAVSIIDNGRMILNASGDVITDKLVFDTNDEKTKEGKLYYSEETPRGIQQVKENVNHIDTPLDLELLFNAAVLNKQEFTEMFK